MAKKGNDYCNTSSVSIEKTAFPKSPDTQTHYASAKALSYGKNSPDRAPQYTPESVISKVKGGK